MLMKNCNTFDFTHKQRFKTDLKLLRATTYVRRAFSAINQVEEPCAFAHFEHS